jgi:hypothetical protein
MSAPIIELIILDLFDGSEHGRDVLFSYFCIHELVPKRKPKVHIGIFAL